MAQRKILLSNELNRTSEADDTVEKFHASACYALLGEIGFLSEEKITMMLDQGKISDRRNRMLEALQKITYAKIATLEGNYIFAFELYEQVAGKISVLNQGSQQEGALTYFYYEYAGLFTQIGDTNAAFRYLEMARSITSSNKMKQMIAYQHLVLNADLDRKFNLKKWLQCIAYFNKYEMTVMESQAHHALALQLIKQENMVDAVVHLDQAHEMAALHGYQYLHRSIDYIRGILLVNQNRNAEARGYYLELLKKVSNAHFTAKIQSKLAELHHILGDADKALEAAKASVEVSQQFSIASELAGACLLLGKIYHRKLTDITKAYFYYQQAFGSIMALAKRGIPINEARRKVINEYVIFLEEHFPGEVAESANEDLFAFSKDLNWVKIKDLFHYNLFLYHYLNTGVGNKTLEALEFPASSFYSATERLRSRGITFPNFRKSDVDIPADNYVEGLQQYARLHRDKTWVEINDCFEKDMLKYHYKLNNYNKKHLAKNLELAYSGIVNRTKYLTSGAG
ncbi:MAG: tetratricopeptide repeat protein [Candidatus Marinimicrobia bacterium]|nr:tetratricopeptide repeat protein [Candidatus Neomarinimicrobiota bacterium]